MGEGSLGPYTVSFAERMAWMETKPYLDVHVTDHCNLRCRGCIHFAPLAERGFLDLNEYERDLDRLAAIEGLGDYLLTLMLMGGEPLLHPRLPQIVRLTRRYLPQATVALCTNGLLLKLMGEDFWSALAEADVQLRISPYPIRVDYRALADLAVSHGVQVRFAVDITGHDLGKEAFLRLAVDPQGTSDPNHSFVRCPFGGRYLQLSQGAIWPCQMAAHHGTLARRFGLDLHASEDDRLPLDGLTTTDQIEAFRRSAHPMCRHCDNDALEMVTWGRSKLDPAEWIVSARQAPTA